MRRLLIAAALSTGCVRSVPSDPRLDCAIVAEFVTVCETAEQICFKVSDYGKFWCSYK
jgi:hypothetical protein